jgi:hypothetical protein
MKHRIVLVVLLLALGGNVMALDAPTANAQAAEDCFLLALFPVRVELCHSGEVIEIIDTEWGPQPVYEIELVKFYNQTGTPWRLSAYDDQDNDWDALLSANEEGEKNIPSPQRYRSFPLTFSITLVRN